MSNDHDDLMDKYMDDLEKIAQRSAKYSASRVPLGTRKFSGQAQASTRLAANTNDLSVTLAPVYAFNAIKDSIDIALSGIEKASLTIKLGDTVYVSSDLDYITRLEYEFGDLMFTKAASKWQEDVDSAVSSIR